MSLHELFRITIFYYTDATPQEKYTQLTIYILVNASEPAVVKYSKKTENLLKPTRKCFMQVGLPHSTNRKK